MSQTYALFAFVFFCSGCLSSKIVPAKDVAERIRIVDIVAMESPPLEITGDVEGGLYGLEGLTGSGAYGPGAGGLVVIYGIVSFIKYTTESKARKADLDNILAMLSDNNNWVPTIALAGNASEILKSCGKLDIAAHAGVLKVPGIADRGSTYFMENWMAPIRDWYNANPSTLSYGNYTGAMPDAILEVGISAYSIYREHLIIHLMLKAVDPKTRTVLARDKDVALAPIGAPKDVFKDGAGKFKRAFSDAGNKLLKELLADMSLCPGK